LLYIDDIVLTASSTRLLNRITASLRLNRITASLRPDIAYAVQQVCLHMHDPRKQHLAAIKRILCYVKGTLSHGL
jgi:hypothetical protein